MIGSPPVSVQPTPGRSQGPELPKRAFAAHCALPPGQQSGPLGKGKRGPGLAVFAFNILFWGAGGGGGVFQLRPFNRSLKVSGWARPRGIKTNLAWGEACGPCRQIRFWISQRFSRGQVWLAAWQRQDCPLGALLLADPAILADSPLLLVFPAHPGGPLRRPARRFQRIPSGGF